MKLKYNVFKAVIVTLLFSSSLWSQTTIAQWNFNGPTNTTVPGGETSPSTSIGIGTAILIGGTTGVTPFPSGNTTPGTIETTLDGTNFGWQTIGYAPAGTDNKLRGVQFNVSTVSQAGIIFRFEQRLSNSANNTYVVQYTTDRTATNPVWVDKETFTFTPQPIGTGDTWYNNRIIDCSSITTLDNNPNVAFRVVSAFDPTVGDYVAARSTNVYSAGTGGTVRFDMVTVSSNTTLGITSFDNHKDDFIIYPNPTNSIVHFNQTHDIQIFDVLGKLILNQKNIDSINISNLRSGVYYLKTENGISRKLIIE